MLYYSSSRRGFFSAAIHDVLPDDVVEITEGARVALLAAQEAGHCIVPDDAGRPIAVAPDPPPPPTLPQQAVALLAVGLTVSCDGVPAIGGVYRCDLASRATLAEVMAGINAGDGFPGGAATFDLDVMGGHVTFPDTTTFRRVAVAVRDFVYQCSQVINGRSETLPSSSVSLA